jgi:hypothetical protein
MTRRLRLIGCVTTTLALTAAVTATATAAVAPRSENPSFRYLDPEGDAVGPASADIVSVSYEVTDRQPGPERQLVVRMELAAPPSDLVDYQTGAEPFACENLDTDLAGPSVLRMSPYLGRSNFYVGCGQSPDPLTGSTTVRFGTYEDVEGRTITWSIPFDRLPAELRDGIDVYHFHAFTHLAEPVSGHDGTGNVGEGLDWASAGSRVWSIPAGGIAA